MQKSKKWRPLNHTLKVYTMDLTRLLAIVGDSTALSALLKHVHAMLPCFVGLQKSSKHLLHRLIVLWSTSEDETVRVLAFMSILRLTRSTLATNFETVVKSMYLAYVRNSKFTSPTTWHAIHFMRRSLAELMSLDAKLVYRHAFVYIRQLAINLRNAITVQKKESIQSVYNWQYVHSLNLWSSLLCDSAAKEEALQQLIFPVVQVMVGAVKLVYTSKYFPLRFHICEMMTELSAKSGKFIPVLPFYLDILRSYDFNKRTTKVSMKPVSFSCVLRVSKSQSAENGSKDAIMDCIHRGMFAYLHQQSHKISFPELAIPALAELKEFIKKCKVANYCKKMKQLTDKIEENSAHIASLRRSAPFGIGSKERIEQWEQSVRENGTPLSTFYTSWAEVKRQEDRKKASEQDSISKHENLPVIKKKAALQKRNEDEEFKGIFGDDQDSDSSEVRIFVEDMRM
jgi:nucleolar complex protein 2